MQFLRTNTAVIVTVGPFYDKTDGVTIEGSLTITNERITLTADTDDGSAPTLVLDNVTGATSGTANDLNYITSTDAGLMQLELAAANVNRLGRMTLTITDAANHVPVFHQYMVLPAVVYDAFILGTDKLQVHVDEMTAGIITATVVADGTIDAATFAASAITATVIADGAIDAATFASGAITADAIAANAIGASELAADAAAEIADAVWDEDATGHQTGGTFGQAIGDPGADTTTIYQSVVTDAAGVNIAADIIAIEAQTDDIGAAGAGLTAIPLGAVWDEDATGHQSAGTFGLAIGDPAASTETLYKAIITDPAGTNIAADVIAIKAETAAILDDTDDIGVAGAGLTAINLPDQTMNITGDITGNLSGSVGSVTGAVGSIAAGGIATTSFAAGAIDAAAIAANAIGSSELAQTAAQEVADEVLDRNLAGGGSGNTRNVRNALRSLRNAQDITAGTLTVMQEDDATPAWTAAVTTAAGDPLASIDPA